MTQRMILRADGRTEPVEGPMTMEQVIHALGGAMPCVTSLRDSRGRIDGRVLLCDDMGHARGLPRNEAATAIYLAQCRPGTTHFIAGDAVVTLDADFAGPDDR